MVNGFRRGGPRVSFSPVDYSERPECFEGYGGPFRRRQKRCAGCAEPLKRAHAYFSPWGHTVCRWCLDVGIFKQAVEALLHPPSRWERLCRLFSSRGVERPMGTSLEAGC